MEDGETRQEEAEWVERGEEEGTGLLFVLK
jgi:hypothetical protein